MFRRYLVFFRLFKYNEYINNNSFYLEKKNKIFFLGKNYLLRKQKFVNRNKN